MPLFGHVAELVYAHVSEACSVRIGSSSLPMPTKWSTIYRMERIYTRIYAWHDIPHYYGDFVRVLFITVAVLAAVAVPLLGDLLPFGTLVQVLSILLLVLLAGLTHPHSVIVFWYNVCVSALAVVLLQYTAVSLYETDSFGLFLAREAGAISMLFAFYYSVKTLRAMSEGKLGKLERPWEFEDSGGAR